MSLFFRPEIVGSSHSSCSTRFRPAYCIACADLRHRSLGSYISHRIDGVAEIRGPRFGSMDISQVRAHKRLGGGLRWAIGAIAVTSSLPRTLVHHSHRRPGCRRQFGHLQCREHSYVSPIIGRTLTLNDGPVTIVVVASLWFDFATVFVPVKSDPMCISLRRSSS
jgi:hypothetical protein